MEVIIAALVSAVVSVSVTLWLRRADRPKPDWIFARLGVPLTTELAKYLLDEREGAHPDFLVMATNAGDGIAYQLEVEGVDADVTLFVRDNDDLRKFRVPAKLALVNPGEDIGVLIWFHPEYDHSKVGFRLRWIHAPVRQMNYDERVVSLADPEPRLRRDWLVARWLRQLRLKALAVLERLSRRRTRI